ncbi:MAG TPA: hypothetical protein VGU71_09310 [Candidatus Dormibacteraeota bacterium]|nr:hypothetical protein [Candidatus Dormibacteraeota bacterium]
MALAAQYGLYHRLLREPLRTHAAESALPAVRRWLKFAIVWQVLVLAGCALYASVLASRHAHSVAWIAPAVGAVFGTALPLQFAVMTILRSGRG